MLSMSGTFVVPCLLCATRVEMIVVILQPAFASTACFVAYSQHLRLQSASSRRPLVDVGLQSNYTDDSELLRRAHCFYAQLYRLTSSSGCLHCSGFLYIARLAFTTSFAIYADDCKDWSSRCCIALCIFYLPPVAA